MQLEDIKRLKELNRVTRICSKKTNEYSKEIVESLFRQINMLQKQKKFLQKKLREVYDAKTKTSTTKD